MKRAKTETLAPWVHQVLLAHEALKVPMELMDHKDPQALLVQLVVWEKRVNQEKQGTQDPLEKPDQVVPKEREERKEKLGPLVLRVLLVLRGHQVMMDPRGIRDLLGFLEILVHLENLVLQGKMVLEVTRVKMEIQDNQVPLVHPVKLALQVHLEREVRLELPVPKEGKERKVLREKLELKDLLGKLARSDLRVLLESLVQKVFEASLVLWENKVSPVLLAKMDPLVLWDLLVYLVSKVILAPRVKRDILV